MNRPRRSLGASAWAGALIWLALACLSAVRGRVVGEPELLFLAAPLVVVPLGLRLDREPDRLARTAGRLQPAGAALAAASFCLASGPLAGALACGWLIVSALVGWMGLLLLRRAGWPPGGPTCVGLGYVYLPVGAAWLVMSRLGGELLGFGEPMVLLTAVHFHFAGFAALLVTGTALGRAVASGAPPRPWEKLALSGVAAGPALVAAGFLISDGARLVATIVLALGLCGVASFIWRRLTVIPAGPARAFLVLSSASVVAGMLLAAIYAWSEWVRLDLLDIPRMVQWHGVINGFGFALSGLVAFNLAD